MKSMLDITSIDFAENIMSMLLTGLLLILLCRWLSWNFYSDWKCCLVLINILSFLHLC